MDTKIKVEVMVDLDVEEVWDRWTDPVHIIKWNNASDDWQTTYSENDLRAGGRFMSRMEARDGSSGFDFTGTYLKVEPFELIEFDLDDGRNVEVRFIGENGKTRVREIFDPENIHSKDVQQQGWQAILDNFKKYSEAPIRFETLNFRIVINTHPDEVYKIMLDDMNYRKWTAAFNPGSYYKGSWEKGEKIIFLGTDENGKEGGMVSRIRENIYGKFVSIEHLGFYQDGQEITTGPEIEAWSGALENYTFTNREGSTLLKVDLDTNPEQKEYFEDPWPRALDILKSLCEEKG